MQEVAGTYTFADGLQYEEAGWSYCREGDRRFYRERKAGIPPAGASMLSDKGKAPRIPAGTFDVGDGYLEPSTAKVHAYDDGTVVREAKEGEVEWALRTCRVGADA